MASSVNTASRHNTQLSLSAAGVSAAPQVLLGPSSSMAVLWSRIQRVGPYFRTVLLTGEAGSGHEAVARALHQLSPLVHRPFTTLLAAEAEQRLASGAPSASFSEGMFYLPEPDRLSHAAQATLHLLLRERGAPAPRLVTFAERGLRSLIGARGFVPELANSLGALQIEVPPLRERLDDIPQLTLFLLDQLSVTLNVPPPALDPTFLPAVSAAAWPGNLDQLHAALQWLLHQGSRIQGPSAQGPPTQVRPVLTSSDLDSALIFLSRTPIAQHPEPRLIRLDQVIREQVQAVLLACNGNKLRAAEILGISRSTLYRMLDSIPNPDSGPNSGPAHS